MLRIIMQLTIYFLLAVQKPITGNFTMAPQTRSDAHAAKFDHVVNVWLSNSPFVLQALEVEQVSTYLELQVLLRDLDKVNALKNKKGDAISAVTIAKLRAAMSLINEEQIKFGNIRTAGVVDITTISDANFDNYALGGSPYVEYSAAAVAKHEADEEAARLTAELGALAVEKAKQELLAVQAAAQITTTSSPTVPTVSGTANTAGTIQTGQGTVSGAGGSQISRPNTSASGGSQAGGTVSNLGTVSNSTTTSTPGLPSSSTSANPELVRMQRSSKPDPDNVDLLSNSADYPTWRLKLTHWAKLYGYQNTLDSNYSPSTNNENETFQFSQISMFGVLDRRVKFPEGREIVRQHLANADAQKIIELLDSKYLGDGSLPKKNNLEEIRNFLSTPMKKESGEKGLLPAIEKWKTYYGRYNDLNGTAVDEDTAVVWLETYLSNVSQLENVSSMSKALEQVLRTHTAALGINLPSDCTVGLESLLALHTHTAQQYDIKKKKSVLSKRRMMVAELRCVNTVRAAYDIDADHELVELTDDSIDDDQWYELYTMKRQRKGLIPSEAYRNLTSEEKRLWNDFSDVTRELILNSRSSKPLDIKAAPAPNRRSIPRRRGSALKSNPSPSQQGPVNQRARVNLTDTTATDAVSDDMPDDVVDDHAAQVNANVTNVRRYLSRQAHAHAWHDPTVLDSVRDTQIRETNQTSHRHPFDMTRFLSQPDDDDGERQLARAVNIHEDVDDADINYFDARSVMLSEAFYDDSDAPPVDTSTLTAQDDDDEPQMCYILRNALARVILGLIDRGANGGVFGDRQSGRIINIIPGKFIDVVGIDQHTISRRPIGSIGMVGRALYNGRPQEVIFIFHQYAILDRGQTIHSSIQMEAFGNVVDDKAIAYGGSQTISTPQGMVIPLDVKNGLVRLQTRAYTDDEWLTLPHVVMTSDAPWVPTPADNIISDDDDWYARQPHNPLSDEENFNMYGEYLHRTTALMQALPSTPAGAVVGAQFQNSFVVDVGHRTMDGDDVIYLPPRLAVASISSSSAIALDIGNFSVSYTAVGSNHNALTHPLRHLTTRYGGQMVDHSALVHERRHIPRDLEVHRRHFLGAPLSVVRHTFDATEQNYRITVEPHTSGLRNTYRSHCPAINVFRRRELVSSDTIFFDLEVQGGYSCCQIYIGRSSFYISAHPMRDSDGEFVNTLEDEIRFRGAMDCFGRDGAEAMKSNRLLTLLRTLHISDWTSEAYFHHQNIVERYIQEVKKLTKRVINWSGCPPEMGLHVIQYVAFVWNRTARQKLGWRTPYEALTGQTPDISLILLYRFWQRLYIKNHRRMGTGFPSGTDEILVHFIGFSENVGHSMTFKVWCPATGKVLHRSRVRPATADDANHPGNPPSDYDGGNVDDYNDMDILHDDDEDFAGGNIEIDESPSSDENGDDASKAEGDGQIGTIGDDIARPIPRTSDNVVDEGQSETIDMREERARTIDGPAGRTRSHSRVRSNADGPAGRTRSHSRERSNDADPEFPNTRPQASPPGLRGNEDVLKNCIGRCVLLPKQEDGQRFRARIVELIEDFEDERDRDPERIKFRCKVGDKEFEKLIEYSQMCEFIEEQVQNEDGTWRFRRITGHSTPKRKSEKPRLLMEWESGEITLEPVYTIAKSDPWVVAEYAVENGVLDEWHSMWPSLKLRRYAKNGKKLLRMINAAKRHSYKNSPMWQYGHQVPRNHREAMELDRLNGNQKWADSEKLEKDQLLQYQTFNDLGHKSTCSPPPGYKKINLHLVYAVKFDGRYKSRIVAGGHLTDTPLESVYSGVVSLRGVRLVLFLAELNGLEVYQSDVGNAYLESYTKEKVYVIGGPELHELEGHILVIVKALYGLKSSGLRWHERFSEVLRDMGFFPCPAEPDIWMRACSSNDTVIDDAELMGKMGSKATTDQPPAHLKDGSYYEYIAVYCDDLTIASKHPLNITNALTGIYKFKLKGTGPLNFLLGCNYFREGKVLCAAPKKYIEKMEATFRRIFGEKPSQKVTSPLECGDNPELDTSEFLDERFTKVYQSMIGAAQWVIQLGRIDIAVHVMTLSSFRAQPRKGHLDRIKRVYGYLCKMNGAMIRFRTDMPDISDFDFPEFDWSNTPHAGAKEEYPTNLPVARGNLVLMSTCVDANLMHDKLSGKSVTGVLHFLNKTPIDWFTKKQGTTETATFGSENNAARTAVEQIKANKLLLHYLGAPLADKPILLGDNESVVNNNTTPHGKLHKRHHILSYTFVRDNVAAGVLRFAHIPGKLNPADILSKHWSYSTVWPIIQPILFWKGDTLKIERKL